MGTGATKITGRSRPGSPNPRTLAFSVKIVQNAGEISQPIVARLRKKESGLPARPVSLFPAG